MVMIMNNLKLILFSAMTLVAVLASIFLILSRPVITAGILIFENLTTILNHLEIISHNKLSLKA